MTPRAAVQVLRSAQDDKLGLIKADYWLGR